MKAKEENIIAAKSYAFSIRCVNLYRFLCEERNDYTIGKQLLRSGTSIGANVKMSIALKEASETEFWIELLRDTNFITEQQANSMLTDCTELIKLLMTIIKTSQGKTIKN